MTEIVSENILAWARDLTELRRMLLSEDASVDARSKTWGSPEKTAASVISFELRTRLR